MKIKITSHELRKYKLDYFERFITSNSDFLLFVGLQDESISDTQSIYHQFIIDLNIFMHETHNTTQSTPQEICADGSQHTQNNLTIEPERQNNSSSSNSNQNKNKFTNNHFYYHAYQFYLFIRPLISTQAGEHIHYPEQFEENFTDALIRSWDLYKNLHITPLTIFQRTHAINNSLPHQSAYWNHVNILISNHTISISQTINCLTLLWTYTDSTLTRLLALANPEPVNWQTKTGMIKEHKKSLGELLTQVKQTTTERGSNSIALTTDQETKEAVITQIQNIKRIARMRRGCFAAQSLKDWRKVNKIDNQESEYHFGQYSQFLK